MATLEPAREANTLSTDNLTGVGVGLRAVATIVDSILLGAIGYAIAYWSSPHHQRFGDRLADTIVTRARKAA